MPNKLIGFGGNRGLGRTECDISHPTAAGILRPATASGDAPQRKDVG